MRQEPHHPIEETVRASKVATELTLRTTSTGHVSFPFESETDQSVYDVEGVS